jgi:hypothetical protein
MSQRHLAGQPASPCCHTCACHVHRVVVGMWVCGIMVGDCFAFCKLVCLLCQPWLLPISGALPSAMP